MLESDRLLAVLPVREGVLPPGTSEAVYLAGGAVLMIGEGVLLAARGLRAASKVRCVDVADFRPAAIAGGLAPLVAQVACVVVPGSADGRTLAARLAFVLDRQLWPNVVRKEGSTGAVCVRADGTPGKSFSWESVRGVVTVKPRVADRCTVAGDACAITSLDLSLPEVPDPQPLGLMASVAGSRGA